MGVKRGFWIETFGEIGAIWRLGVCFEVERLINFISFECRFTAKDAQASPRRAQASHEASPGQEGEKVVRTTSWPGPIAGCMRRRNARGRGPEFVSIIPSVADWTGRYLGILFLLIFLRVLQLGRAPWCQWERKKCFCRGMCEIATTRFSLQAEPSTNCYS